MVLIKNYRVREIRGDQTLLHWTGPNPRINLNTKKEENSLQGEIKKSSVQFSKGRAQTSAHDPPRGMLQQKPPDPSNLLHSSVYIHLLLFPVWNVTALAGESYELEVSLYITDDELHAI